MSKDIISIVYICDDNYVMPTCVSIQSIYENRQKSIYDIYIIGVNLSDKNKNLFKQIDLSGININLLEFPNKYKDLNTNHVYVSKAALFKFDISNILKDLDKVLYIDSDTIILGDLKDFFEIDVKDFYAGVIRDYPAYYKRQDYEEINTSDYFNSGVMLLNLKRLRTFNVAQKLLNYKLSFNSTRYMDQDCFNVVFNGNVKYLVPEYNYMTSSVNLYPDNIKPIIVHTTTGKKPWYYSYVPYADEWYKLFKNSVCRKQKLKRSFICKEKLGNNRVFHIGKIKISYKKNRKDLVNKYYKKFDNLGYSIRRLKNNSIEIKNKNLILVGKSDNTLWTATEVLCNTGYNFSVNEPYIMFDIGFNIGTTSLYFAQKENIKKIYAFEPFIPTYKQGLNNLKLNPKYSDKINLFDFGLGAEDKILKIPYNEELPGTMSTIFKNSTGKFSSIEEVKIKNAYNVLSEIIERHNEKVFIKLDTEGSEFEIIPLLDEKGLLEKVDVLIMEYHRKGPQNLLDILKRNNFFYFQEKMNTVAGIIKAVKFK